MEPDSPKRVEQFMQLLVAHQGRLYQYVRMMLPRYQEVDDVLQETFLVMWRKYDESTPPGGFYTWACRIAYLEVLKSRDRTIQRSHILNQEILDQLADDEAAEPESLTDIKVFLQTCLDKLPPDDRTLIERRYEPGVRVDAMAAELGRPVNSVSKSLGRIRQSLWQCVDAAVRAQSSEERRGQ
jgi:RNA polymerase sigma-70 factor (ECF subfamily)